MDINILVLLLIAALIVGAVVGWMLARGQAGGTINELESRVHTAQTVAEVARRDFTNAQSELAIKESHIKTLDASIGILEEKLRRAAQGDKEGAATVAQLREELRRAAAARSACEAELRQRGAELSELRTQLAKARSEADELRAQIAAAEIERESAALRAQFAADAAEPAKQAERQTALTELARAQAQAQAAIQAEQAKVATLEAQAAGLRNEVRELRDALATLTSSGAELVADYEKRVQEYEDQLTRLQVQQASTAEEMHAQRAALAAELDAFVAGQARLEMQLQARTVELAELSRQRAALAAELDAFVAGQARLETQLQARAVELAELSRQRDAIRRDLQTETTSKAELASLLQARESDLSRLRSQLSALDAGLDGVIQSSPGVVARLAPTTIGQEAQAAPPEILAKCDLVRDLVNLLITEKSELESRLQMRSSELDETRQRLAALQADIGALLTGDESQTGQAPVAIGAELPEDTQARLALLKDRLQTLSAANAELSDLRTRFSEIQARVDDLLTLTEVPRGEAPPDLQARLDLLKARVTDLDRVRATLAAQVGAGAAELNDLRARLGEVEADLDAWLRTQAGAPEGEIPADLKGKLALFKTGFYSLRQAREEAEARLRQEGARLADLTEQLTRAQGELAAAVQAKADLVAQMDSLASARADLEARLTATNSALHARELEFSQLQNRLDELAAASSQLAALQQELDAANARSADFEARLAQVNALAASAQGEAAALRAQLAELQARLDAAVAERDALKGELEARATAIAEAPADPLMLIRQHVQEAKEATIRATAEAGREVKPSRCPQDLAMIRGIGSVFRQRLYAAGIGTFWELAHLTDDNFKHILQLDDRQLMRIDYEAIRTDARRLALETDSVGRMWQGEAPDDLEKLQGIGSVYKRKLYEAGICTFEALASASVEQLMAICPPTKLLKPDHADWIAQARIMAQDRQREA